MDTSLSLPRNHRESPYLRTLSICGSLVTVSLLIAGVALIIIKATTQNPTIAAIPYSGLGSTIAGSAVSFASLVYLAVRSSKSSQRQKQKSAPKTQVPQTQTAPTTINHAPNDKERVIHSLCEKWATIKEQQQDWSIQELEETLSAPKNSLQHPIFLPMLTFPRFGPYNSKVIELVLNASKKHSTGFRGSLPSPRILWKGGLENIKIVCGSGDNQAHWTSIELAAFLAVKKDQLESVLDNQGLSYTINQLERRVYSKKDLDAFFDRKDISFSETFANHRTQEDSVRWCLPAVRGQ